MLFITQGDLGTNNANFRIMAALAAAGALETAYLTYVSEALGR